MILFINVEYFSYFSKLPYPILKDRLMLIHILKEEGRRGGRKKKWREGGREGGGREIERKGEISLYQSNKNRFFPICKI